MGTVITVAGLHKSYGQLEAVRGVDLDVHEGEIFAFLGPNGAGKTTTVEILEGYRTRTSGHVDVLGADPSRSTAAWRSRIGVVLQTCQVWSLLTVRESLELHAGYYPSPRDVEETMALAGLAEQRDQRAGKLSGGQQRRLDVALALIGDPELLFLDEPTTGFDPAARRAAWEVVSSLGKLGKTVFLTTHYMDEAEYLADRVAIIKDGRIVAQGRPDQLAGGEQGVTSIRFRLPAGVGADELPAGIGPTAVQGDGNLRIASREPVRDLAELCGWAVARGVELEDLEAVRPRLEDVYLDLTRSSEA
ncbi:MAG: ABC transporter ATP-binding protein [Actinomycetota bacterium]|nr:ABC transporter ATP-binding protein [Actinomycetota bacterium]